MKVILNNIDKIVTNQGTEVDLENIQASGDTDLGISVSTAGLLTEYEFNATTPTGLPSMDTSSLSIGSTMMWNGSSWVDSGLIIETA